MRLLRIPEVVLNSLSSKSRDKEYKYRDLYRNLYNPEFYLRAYQKVAPKEGNMTAGSDGQTIDGMSTKRINDLISKIKDESYQPNPARRKYIDKKNGGKRPLGIPSMDDKLVQEVVRMVLEAIYEGSFKDSSHGFRPNRSCHTALKQVKNLFTGVRWFVEGDIKGFFDNIDHATLIAILRKRIEDEKFIRLIWKFLRAGYLEDWQYHGTYSGTPQGGIVSPLLANIYLNEFDRYMSKYQKDFNAGKERKRNPEYRLIESRRRSYQRTLEKNKDIWDEAKKAEYTEGINRINERIKVIPALDPMDEEFRRFIYVRYADDFLIGIIGSKQEAEKVRADAALFLKENLKLELSMEKTLITHSSKFAKFLGYGISVQRDTSFSEHGRTRNYKPYLLLPKAAWEGKLRSLGALVTKDDGSWKSIHRQYLIDNDDLEIVSIYNSEIRGLYNYYRLANNVSVLNQFHYIMEYSMYKTFARKYRISVRQVTDKYKINGKFAVKYMTKKGEKIRFFFNESFSKHENPLTDPDVDKEPNTLIYSGRSSLVDRLLANKCEWCEAETEIEMHHVRKLKDLKGKAKWEQFMIARRRKTLALCRKCHDDLHAGRLD